MRISEILRNAAEHHLAMTPNEDQTMDPLGRRRDMYSCRAVMHAAMYANYDAWGARGYTESFLVLNELDGSGLEHICLSYQERQEARYAWLHLLAYIAEGEGL